MFLVCFQACAHRVPPPPDMVESAEEILRLARGQGQAVTSLSTEARISVYGPEGARKGRMVLLAQRPASLHASVLSPTDDLLAVTVSDGTRFTSFERGAPICHQGESCPENVTRLLPVPLDGADLVSILLGAPPKIGAQSPTTTWDARAGAYRIDGVLAPRDDGTPGGAMTLWVSHGDWLLKRLSFDGVAPLPPSSRVVVTWDDPQQVSGRSFPHRIRMSVEKAGLDVQLRYRDVELNAELGEDAFRTPCPPGTEIYEAPCPYDGLEREPQPERDSGTDGSR
jgi:outer membrane lipoprotein-sorting protein